MRECDGPGCGVMDNGSITSHKKIRESDLRSQLREWKRRGSSVQCNTDSDGCNLAAKCRLALGCWDFLRHKSENNFNPFHNSVPADVCGRCASGRDQNASVGWVGGDCWNRPPSRPRPSIRSSVRADGVH